MRRGWLPCAVVGASLAIMGARADAAVIVNPTSVNVTEGGATGTYSVVLSTAPTAAVLITVSGDAQVTVAPSILSFSTTNYATAQEVTVTAVDDTAVEGNHTGTITHSASSADLTYNGIAINNVTANITDNEQAPQISIADVTVAEGNTGTVDAVFAVTLSAAPTGQVTVQYTTQNGSATGGVACGGTVDYETTTGTLTFDAGQTQRDITVRVCGDLSDENDETFQVVLSNAVGATIQDGQGTGTITDDDELPTVTLSATPLQILESGGTATVTATLSAPSASVVSVTLSFAGTATQVTDYTASGTQIQIPAGSTSGSITITAVDDTVSEGDETVFMVVTQATNATADGQQATVTILDDEPSVCNIGTLTVQWTRSTGQVTITGTTARDIVVLAAVPVAEGDFQAAEEGDPEATPPVPPVPADPATAGYYLTINGQHCPAPPIVPAGIRIDQVQQILINTLDGDDIIDATGLIDDAEAEPPLFAPGVTVNAGPGDDTLRGGYGDDTLNGEDGDDRIFGNHGNDTLDGGAGTDTLIYELLEGQDAAGDVGAVVDLDSNTAEDIPLATDAFGIPTGDTLVDDTFEIIEGSSLNDTLIGDPLLPTTIHGNEGDDIITGGADDDVLYGDTDDPASEEGGNDTINGGLGDDEIHGGPGNDSITGGPAALPNPATDVDADTITGDAGDDAIDGGAGNDILYGDSTNTNNEDISGDDTINGGIGDDEVYGGPGDDDITGGPTFSSTGSDSDDDVLHGNAGDDVIRGGMGNDYIYGEAGDDGTEDDPCDGGPGNDTMYGGDGDDYLVGGGTELPEESLLPPKDRSVSPLLKDVFSDVVHGGGGDDTLVGGSGNDYLNGDTGDDVLRGGGGSDYLFGGLGEESGDDNLDGGPGNDVISGGAGDDELRGGGDYDILDYYREYGGAGVIVNLCEETCTDTWGGEDKLHGYWYMVRMSNDDDTFYGYLGDPNRVLGMAGDDHIYGGNEHDIIFGGYGDDVISGRGGVDYIFGGSGNDIISGGADPGYLFGDGDPPLDSDYNFIPDFELGEPTPTNPLASYYILSYETLAGINIGVLPLEATLPWYTGLDGVYYDLTSLTQYVMPGDLQYQWGSDTIIGGADPDIIVGGGGSDGIGDTIQGLVTEAAGDPCTGAQPGDPIEGDDGRIDAVDGRGGGDVIFGDLFVPASEAPYIPDATYLTSTLWAGDDYLRGNGGDDDSIIDDDIIYGCGGDDRIGGDAGDDYLFGDFDYDFLDLDGEPLMLGTFTSWSGRTADDGFFDADPTIVVGNDYIWGGSGDDHIFGGAGDDYLMGDGTGESGYFGEPDDDIIQGNAGDDHIYGGNGFITPPWSNATAFYSDLADFSPRDIVDYSTAAVSGVKVRLGGSMETMAFGFYAGQATDDGDRDLGLDGAFGTYDDTTYQDTIYGIENVVGTDYDDIIVGTSEWAPPVAPLDPLSQQNIVEVQRDITTHRCQVYGFSVYGYIRQCYPFLSDTKNYANILVGRQGNDIIMGRMGQDLLLGGEGDDTIFGGTNPLYNNPDAGMLARHPQLGGSARPAVSTPAFEALVWEMDDDMIYGQWGDDWLYGDGGNDFIRGGPGADHLWGGAGTDGLDYTDPGTDGSGYSADFNGVVVNLRTETVDLQQLEAELQDDPTYLPRRLTGATGFTPLPLGPCNPNEYEICAGMAADGGDPGISYAIPPIPPTFNSLDTIHDEVLVEPDPLTPLVRDRFELVIGSSRGDLIMAHQERPTVLIGMSGNDILIGSDSTERLADHVNIHEGNIYSDQIFGDSVEASAEAFLLPGDAPAVAPGDDLIEGGLGDDKLVAGGHPAGSIGDFVSYTQVQAVVNVSLSNSMQQDTGGAGSDVLVGFQNLIGSDFSDLNDDDPNNDGDRLTGSYEHNLIFGGDGDDRLFGAPGNDELFGNVGQDFADYQSCNCVDPTLLSVTHDPLTGEGVASNDGQGWIDLLHGIETVLYPAGPITPAPPGGGGGTVPAAAVQVVFSVIRGEYESLEPGGEVEVEYSATGGVPPYTATWDPTTDEDDSVDPAREIQIVDYDENAKFYAGQRMKATASPIRTMTFKLTIKDSLGTVANPIFFKVTVAEELVLLAPADRSIRLGGRTTLEPKVSGGEQPYKWEWTVESGGDGGFLTADTIPVVTVAPLETTVYEVTVTDNIGTIATDTVKVTVGGATALDETDGGDQGVQDGGTGDGGSFTGADGASNSQSDGSTQDPRRSSSVEGEGADGAPAGFSFPCGVGVNAGLVMGTMLLLGTMRSRRRWL